MIATIEKHLDDKAEYLVNFMARLQRVEERKSL